jgi:hypothetical protein
MFFFRIFTPSINRCNTKAQKYANFTNSATNKQAVKFYERYGAIIPKYGKII